MSTLKTDNKVIKTAYHGAASDGSNDSRENVAYAASSTRQRTASTVNTNVQFRYQHFDESKEIGKIASSTPSTRTRSDVVL